MPRHRVALVCIAIVAGLAAGSYRPLRSLLSQDGPPEATGSRIDERTPDLAGQRPATALPTGHRSGQAQGMRQGRETATAEASVVMVSDELSLVRAARDGQFIGYEVLKNISDPRFAAGDVIIEIDGEPVEDSAAGTELLTIGLMNPDAKISVGRSQP